MNVEMFQPILFSGTDFCAAGNDCHDNASCVNLATRYACQCKHGFKGTGQTCEGKCKTISKYAE